MISPYYQDEGVTQYCSDALTVLRRLGGDTVDLLVTDPPYGISFMGKSWDKALPDKDIWAECFRVLKAGSFAFVMSIPRADCLSRMIISLEDAGFNVGFSPIFWAYASGFPKAQNIGKAVDKRGGTYLGKELCELIKKRRLELNLSTIELAESGHFYGKVNHGGTVSNWEEGKGIPTLQQYNKLIGILGLEGNPIVEAKREVVEIEGKQKSAICWGEHYGNRKEVDFTVPFTPQAKALDGSYGGFQPKPAVEVIIVCMKPLSEKTFVDQALKNGKGITWIDDCRIPFEIEQEENYRPNAYNHKGHGFTFADETKAKRDRGDLPDAGFHNSKGRFPANLLVSDDVLNDGREHSSGNMDSIAKQAQYNTYGQMYERRVVNPASSGSFSRYFDLDKWAQTLPFLIVPKASKSEKNKGLDMVKGEPPASARSKPAEGRSSALGKPRQNSHPTVKPLKLMSYLITLGSRAGDIVLDPFLGSGTTALASKLLGRKCIGIEIEGKYCEIAAKRCSQSVMELKV